MRKSLLTKIKNIAAFMLLPKPFQFTSPSRRFGMYTQNQIEFQTESDNVILKRVRDGQERYLTQHKSSCYVFNGKKAPDIYQLTKSAHSIVGNQNQKSTKRKLLLAMQLPAELIIYPNLHGVTVSCELVRMEPFHRLAQWAILWSEWNIS